MEEILRQLIGSLSHHLQGSIHPRWCRISSINSFVWIYPPHQDATHQQRWHETFLVGNPELNLCLPRLHPGWGVVPKHIACTQNQHFSLPWQKSTRCFPQWGEWLVNLLLTYLVRNTACLRAYWPLVSLNKALFQTRVSGRGRTPPPSFHMGKRRANKVRQLRHLNNGAGRGCQGCSVWAQMLRSPRSSNEDVIEIYSWKTLKMMGFFFSLQEPEHFQPFFPLFTLQGFPLFGGVLDSRGPVFLLT